MKIVFEQTRDSFSVDLQGELPALNMSKFASGLPFLPEGLTYNPNTQGIQGIIPSHKTENAITFNEEKE